MKESSRINGIRGWFFTPRGAAWYFGVTYGLTFFAHSQGWLEWFPNR